MRSPKFSPIQIHLASFKTNLDSLLATLLLLLFRTDNSDILYALLTGLLSFPSRSTVEDVLSTWFSSGGFPQKT